MAGENDNLNYGDDLQRELDEALSDMSLASLIDLDTKPQTPAGEGNVRRGKVIGFQGKDIFVDMGGKSQGVLTLEAWGNKELPEVGDWIEVTIEGYDKSDGLLVLSRQGAVRAATWAKLEEGSIVEGRVTGHNKGGLELDVDGIKAFMPISHVELERIEELAPYVNRRIKCQITEIRRDERQLLVSRRSVLKMEQEEARQQSFETLVEGQTVQGKVRTIMPYGAFVEIVNGVDGLLHVKDMSYSRVDDPKSVVTEGQQLEVMILKIDRESRKLSLGLKQVMPDPWREVEIKYPVDTILIGRVTRLAEFGAFVELEPAVEGLVPIGEMSFERRIKHPSEIANVGDTIKVRVLNVDPAARRIGLSIKRVGEDPWVGASVRWPVDSIVTGTVKRLAEFGAFVELTPGVEGLVHISELSDTRVRSASEVVREGQSVQVKVLEVDEERHRISLSVKAVAASPDYAGEPAPDAEPAKPKKERKKPLKGGLEFGSWL